MKKEVVLFTCDICKATAESVGGHPRLTEEPLPKDWVKVIANSNDQNVLNLDLCPKCIGAITDAIDEEVE